jgi:ribonuclease VapC
VRFVVDTSAIVAIIGQEPEGPAFHQVLLDGEPMISAATVVELGRVAMHRLGVAGVAEVRALLDDYEVAIEPVDEAQVAVALAGMVAYGKGRGEPPAVLNFGDLFGYALAKEGGLPLLFKGEDFTQTDIESALDALAAAAATRSDTGDGDDAA